MIALTFTYTHSVPIRKPIIGGMDSEYSHTEVQTGTTTVVVPRDCEEWVLAARNYVENYAGHFRDKNFKLSPEVGRLPVDAILNCTKRLD